MFLVTLTVACGSSSSDAPSPDVSPPAASFAPSPTGQPQTVEAARELLDLALGRGSAGDHPSVWDLLVPEDQALIERSEYVVYQRTCNADSPRGLPYEIADIRLEEPQTAVAGVKVLGFSILVHAFFRDGRWLTQFTDTNREGVQAWVTSRTCLPDS